MMDTVNESLAAILNEANFDIEYTRSARAHRGMSATQLQEIYSRQEEQSAGRRVRVHAPEALMEALVNALRIVLEPAIDPETDQIGHAFPIEGGTNASSCHFTIRADGLYDMGFTSSLRAFASATVQAAAIVGGERAARLLTEWKRGEPVRLHVSTVLNNLPISAPVVLRDDIRIVPLALTTARLPRLPDTRNVFATDYLGLTMLQLGTAASPPLFRPNVEGREPTAKSRSADGIDFNLVCEALSLEANRHVAQTLSWLDYPDAAPFCLEIHNSWSRGDERVQPRARKRESFNLQTGITTITPSDDVVSQGLNEDDFRRTLEALRNTDKSLRVAVERWRRSKLPSARPENQYIELRIALEALYLKDFANENTGELKFRLSLFGAWHLADGLDERRSIRKALRNAYDTASEAVHTGEIRKGARARRTATQQNLDNARDLCRRGILKLLREGPPQDWGDLILGAEVR